MHVNRCLLRLKVCRTFFYRELRIVASCLTCREYDCNVGLSNVEARDHESIMSDRAMSQK